MGERKTFHLRVKNLEFALICLIFQTLHRCKKTKKKKTCKYSWKRILDAFKNSKSFFSMVRLDGSSATLNESKGKHIMKRKYKSR